MSRPTHDPNPSMCVDPSGGEGTDWHPFLATVRKREYNDHDMDDAMNREGDDRERTRPRVVDKRVSARPEPSQAPSAPLEAGPPEPPPAQPEPPPQVAAGAEGPPAGGPGEPPLWTPEQEAEAQRFAQQVVETPSRDWVVNTAVTLANVAAAKLEAGAAADAELAIDALAGIVSGVGPQLGDAEGPLRQTLAQLQMAFAQGPIPRGPAGP
jgi:hypothetical protein